MLDVNNLKKLSVDNLLLLTLKATCQFQSSIQYLSLGMFISLTCSLCGEKHNRATTRREAETWYGETMRGETRGCKDEPMRGET